MVSQLVETSLFGEWELRQPSYGVQQKWGIEALWDIRGSSKSPEGRVSCAVYGGRYYVYKRDVQAFLSRMKVSPQELSDEQTELVVQATADALLRVDATREMVGATLTKWLEPLPSVRELVEEFKSRRWNPAIPVQSLGFSQSKVAAYMLPGVTFEAQKATHERDQERLLRILRVYNNRFRHKCERFEENDDGVVEPVTVTLGEKICVRADLHCNLRSLIALMESLKDPQFDQAQAGFLDELFRCKPGRKLIFCGDLGDKGLNHVEIYTLLSTMLLTDPSIKLVRGNHESVDMNASYSVEAGWILRHRDVWEQFYRILPLALCLRGEAGEAYGHISHGLFSPAVDLAPLFDGTEDVIVVPKRPAFSMRMVELMQHASCKKIRAAAHILLQLEEQALRSSGYTWATVSEEDVEEVGRKVRYPLSITSIQAYRLVAAGLGKKLGFFIRGHDGNFFEVVKPTEKRSSKEKIILTSLPVADEASTEDNGFQALLLTVAENVKAWTKQRMGYVTEDGGARYELVGPAIPMFESLDHEETAAPQVGSDSLTRQEAI